MSMINLESMLENFEHDPSVYLELIDTFLELGHVNFDELESLLTTKKYTDLTYQLHKLKGAALLLGAIELGRSAGKLEADIRLGSLADATLLLTTLRGLYNSTRSEMEQIKKSLQMQL